MVDVAQVLVDANGRAARSGAEIDEVFVNRGDAVVVADAASDVFADFRGHFFRGHGAVRSEREDDAHVFVGHAEAVHLFDEDRHEDFAVGNARRVVADEGDGVARANDFLEGLRADRMADRVKNGAAHVFKNGQVFRANDFENVVGFVFEGLGASAVSEGVGLFCHGCLVPQLWGASVRLSAKSPTVCGCARSSGRRQTVSVQAVCALAAGSVNLCRSLPVAEAKSGPAQVARIINGRHGQKVFRSPEAVRTVASNGEKEEKARKSENNS